MKPFNPQKFLPLSETTYYILLALTEPLHGYAVMQHVDQISQGVVSLGPGTLYGAFSTLEKEGLIRMISAQDRRKTYALTEYGKAVLGEQIRRIELMYKNGQSALQKLENGGQS